MWIFQPPKSYNNKNDADKGWTCIINNVIVQKSNSLCTKQNWCQHQQKNHHQFKLIRCQGKLGDNDESMQSHWLVLNKFPLQRLLYNCTALPLLHHNLWRTAVCTQSWATAWKPLCKGFGTETQICEQLISCYVSFRKYFTKLCTQKFSWRHFLNINTDTFPIFIPTWNVPVMLTWQTG